MILKVDPIKDCDKCVFNDDFIMCNLSYETTNYSNGEFDLSSCPLLHPEKIESEQVQVVVKCKDCKYGEVRTNGKGEPMIECGLMYDDAWLKEPNWFCADGERREET